MNQDSHQLPQFGLTGPVGKVAQPLRVAVVGRAASPSIDVTLHLVGREACLRRIDRAVEFIRSREGQG